jgi:hypothetical protein
MKILWIAIVLTNAAFAGKAEVKLKDVNTSDDTSIIIKKGAPIGECVEHEIIEGRDDISGDPAFARDAAHTGWKNACKEWKTSMREMNKDNQMISLNCNTPIIDKSGDMYTYKSSGSYRMKVRMKEKKQ